MEATSIRGRAECLETQWVRAATPRDILAIHRLSIDCLESDAWTLEDFIREAREPYTRLHVVDRADAGIVAYALAWLVVDEATVVQVGTHPRWRRRRIAFRLLEEVLLVLAIAGARSCHLEVRRSRAGVRALYEKLGFSVRGVRKGYYRAPADDACVMSMAL